MTAAAEKPLADPMNPECLGLTKVAGLMTGQCLEPG